VTARGVEAGADGHAAGYDVAPSTDHVPLIPRRTGDPVTFAASLDKSPIKATSGGWAHTASMTPILSGSWRRHGGR